MAAPCGSKSESADPSQFHQVSGLLCSSNSGFYRLSNTPDLQPPTRKQRHTGLSFLFIGGCFLDEEFLGLVLAVPVLPVALVAVLLLRARVPANELVLAVFAPRLVRVLRGRGHEPDGRVLGGLVPVEGLVEAVLHHPRDAVRVDLAHRPFGPRLARVPHPDPRPDGEPVLGVQRGALAGRGRRDVGREAPPRVRFDDLVPEEGRIVAVRQNAGLAHPVRARVDHGAGLPGGLPVVPDEDPLADLVQWDRIRLGSLLPVEALLVVVHHHARVAVRVDLGHDAGRPRLTLVPHPDPLPDAVGLVHVEDLGRGRRRVAAE
mmetsp:Transcript_1175/g.1596  ORF Transcript_1175/g.1596 Transcript_1175/m.1596 type:complete len:318 (+) Transcript_1175:75-1028(+)